MVKFYAELAGLPAVTGLYTSVTCLVAYAIFGPSKVLVLGPDSSLGPMIAATLLPLMASGGDPAKAVALASMLSLMTGAIMVAAGAGRLGLAVPPREAGDGAPWTARRTMPSGSAEASSRRPVRRCRRIEGFRGQRLRVCSG